MAIREILLSLTPSPAGEAALVTALLAAERWGAHLTALRVPRGPGAQDRDARALFDRLVASRDVPTRAANTDPGRASADYTEVAGREEEILAHRARLADMTVVRHPDAGGEVSSSGALHAVLFASGRPVLVAPPMVPVSIGTRVCLAWNGTAESAESAMSAMPWMRRADAVRILSAEGYQRYGPDASELVDYLALHDINADIEIFQPLRNSVGTGLLRSARLFDCDLLSMGAYSHSRLRQLILGGVTQHVLENATLPVMMTR